MNRSRKEPLQTTTVPAQKLTPTIITKHRDARENACLIGRCLFSLTHTLSLCVSVCMCAIDVRERYTIGTVRRIGTERITHHVQSPCVLCTTIHSRYLCVRADHQGTPAAGGRRNPPKKICALKASRNKIRQPIPSAIATHPPEVAQKTTFYFARVSEGYLYCARACVRTPVYLVYIREKQKSPSPAGRLPVEDEEGMTLMIFDDAHPRKKKT